MRVWLHENPSARCVPRGQGMVVLGVSLAILMCPLLGMAQTSRSRDSKRPLTVVVMDPLAAPLACSCVKGFAQRKYDRLAIYLQKRLGRKVRLMFAEDLARALRGSAGAVDLVIGKDCLVRFDADEYKLPLIPLARLTGTDGRTTLTGLFVVPAGDPAKQIADLEGYRVIFGPEESAEKSSAAVTALKKAGVTVPKQRETSNSCNEAAFAALENKTDPGAVAVISSYAKVLMEGCGAIDKGTLRVVGQTDEVPFVTVFAAKSVSQESRGEILKALLAVQKDASLLVALESKRGFVPIESEAKDDSSDGP